MVARKRSKPLAVAVFLVLAVVFLRTEGTAAPYYEGKVMKIVVGSAPGGGYDRMARLIAKHLPRHIPGKPSVIIENMDGAVGIVASNYLYNIAKPNGLTIGAIHRTIPSAHLLKADGARFDVTKFSWIGSTAVEGCALSVRADLPYRTIYDLQKAKEPIYIATAGPGGMDHQFPVLLMQFIGLNLKIVSYPSSAAGMLAIERREAMAKAGAYSSLKPFVERGLVRPLVRGRVSEPETANLPVDEDLTTDALGKTIMAMRSTSDKMGRPFVAPPGTPADIMNILRDAFAKVTKDPALIEDAKKNMMKVEYTSAKECMNLTKYLLNQPQDMVREFGKYMAL